MPGRIPSILLVCPVSLPAASHALHFDGLDDKVRVEPFEHELSAFTIEAWVRKTSPTDYYFDTIVSTDQFRTLPARGCERQQELESAMQSWRSGASSPGRAAPNARRRRCPRG